MDYHTIVVNAILSFKAPFTYEELIEKIKETIEITDENEAVITKKVEEIFELSTVRNVPFSTKYYMIGTASDPNPSII